MTSFIAVSDWAKDCFKKYEAQGFKVLNETGSQVLFGNLECDMTSKETYLKTHRFSFWMYKHTDVRRLELRDHGGNEVHLEESAASLRVEGLSAWIEMLVPAQSPNPENNYPAVRMIDPKTKELYAITKLTTSSDS